MITVLWSQTGLIHYEFLTAGETITPNKYCTQIVEINKKLAVMGLTMVYKKIQILLHDNARPHVTQQTLEKLNNLKFETLSHPPYSPDFSLKDYHLALWSPC